jgi:hypothetical protein
MPAFGHPYGGSCFGPTIVQVVGPDPRFKKYTPVCGAGERFDFYIRNSIKKNRLM